jgi:hypothetical protein
MVIENVKGNYRFIRGGGPFSSGCAALPGCEIVHAAIRPWVPLARGFDLVERHLQENRRPQNPHPINALCGMHLRIPHALTATGFEQFNRPYIERLKSWGLEVDGANPVARTNVALEVSPVPEAMLAGFYYTTKADGIDGEATTFVLSGAAEMRLGDNGRRELVASGDTSAEGIRRKLECVIEGLTGHLRDLNVGWDQATAVNLYTVRDVYPVLGSMLLPAIGAAAQVGVNWHYSRPPVIGLEVEIDLHAVRREVILSP